MSTSKYRWVHEYPIHVKVMLMDPSAVFIYTFVISWRSSKFTVWKMWPITDLGGTNLKPWVCFFLQHPATCLPVNGAMKEACALWGFASERGSTGLRHACSGSWLPEEKKYCCCDAGYMWLGLKCHGMVGLYVPFQHRSVLLPLQRSFRIPKQETIENRSEELD